MIMETNIARTGRAIKDKNYNFFLNNKTNTQRHIDVKKITVSRYPIHV